MLNYTPRTGAFLPRVVGEIVDTVDRGRPTKWHAPKPTAPFSSQPDDALTRVFDRETGEMVDSEGLKTYADVLAQYHLSPVSGDKQAENAATIKLRTDVLAVVLA